MIFLLFTSIHYCTQIAAQNKRGRARDYNIRIGILNTGQYNAITDVKGVKVGHTTVILGDSIRTGVTAIVPHSGNIFQEKVPAGVFVGNGFGKSIGLPQIAELGNIETPILLTNTLSVPVVSDALSDYILSIPENHNIRSINTVVGETNDGLLNDIRGKHITKYHALEALKVAKGGYVQEGNVGAGTGTEALGFKGGIGTSSRILPPSKGGYTVGVLVQSNFGGILNINGVPVGRELNNFYMKDTTNSYKTDGSCMIIIATDAPLSPRNLERLAKRSYISFGNVGGFSANGSGDFSIAFSTYEPNRVPYITKEKVRTIQDLSNDEMTPLFLAVWEATEEAIINSLFAAEDMIGKGHRNIKALPIEKTIDIMNKYNMINFDKLPTSTKK